LAILEELKSKKARGDKGKEKELEKTVEVSETVKGIEKTTEAPGAISAALIDGSNTDGLATAVEATSWAALKKRLGQ
jgi:hypothetical protein